LYTKHPCCITVTNEDIEIPDQDDEDAGTAEDDVDDEDEG
jgi:hypothetical protein